MKRTLFSFAAVLVLTTSGLAAAQSEQPYPEGANQEQSGSVDQQPSTTSDQPPATPTDPAATSSSLPATATPLPLMGLGGLASLALGALLSRSRRKS